MIASALPLVPAPVCPILGPLGTICQAANGVGSTVVGAGANDVLSAFSTWVVGGATWLLDQIGGVLNATTSIDLGASWFSDHYRLMAGLAAVVVLPLLLVSVLQAVYRQNAGILVRSALVQLPLALVLTAVAVQLVQLALGATDAMSAAIATGTGADLQSALSNLASVLGALAGTGDLAVPAFVVLLGALLVVAGSLLLWVELLVRAAAVYAAVLFLPLALASLVWPAVAHWCRRLVDTLVALVLSKFVIVAILSLAVSAVGGGSGASLPSVLAGGALLLLAAFSPFTLLRLIPMVEAGAVHQLEGARHRVQQAFGSLPRSAASYALARLAPVPALGAAGTGIGAALEAPGGAEPVGPSAALPRATSSGSLASEESAGVANDALPAEMGGIPAWRGVSPPELPTGAAPGAGATGGTRRGPPPFIGVEGPSSGSSPAIEKGSGPPAPAVVTVAGIGGTHALERDRLGPVIRWRPALPQAASAPSGIDAET